MFKVVRRIVNPKAIEAVRRNQCEICPSRWGVEVHHIFTRGANGPDIPENLINLCKQHHHGSIPPRHVLIAKVAEREGRTPEEVEDIIRESRRTGVYNPPPRISRNNVGLIAL